MRARAWILAVLLSAALPAATGAAVPITVTTVPTTLVEGTPYSGVLARFTYDCGVSSCPLASAFNVSLAFSSGLTVSEAAPGSYEVTGSFTPQDDRAYSLITITGPGGSLGHAFFTVHEAPIAVSIQSADVAPGQAVSNVLTYTDAGLLPDQVTIDWGDGSTSRCVGSNLLRPPQYQPQCSHTYSRRGSYRITGRVIDDATVFTGSGTTLVESLALRASVPHGFRMRHLLSLVVTPTVAATVHAGGTLLIPGRHRGIHVSSGTSSPDHDRSVRLFLYFSRHDVNLVRLALRHHRRPWLRLRITGTPVGSGQPPTALDRKIRLAR